MLLKVITWNAVTRVITGIEDVQIHPGIAYSTYESLWDHARKAPSPSLIDIVMPETTSFDEIGQQSSSDNQIGLVNGGAGLVDYFKGGYWHRLIVSNHAYLCNDDGKTIAKINC